MPLKIEKEQISGIKLKSTVSLFLIYPVCCEIQYFVLNDNVGASKTIPTLSSHDRDVNGDAKAEKGLGRDRGCGGKL